jgi:L-fucose isomerase-like protein
MDTKLSIIGYYSNAHDVAITKTRINDFISGFKKLDFDFEFEGSYSDKDFEGHKKLLGSIKKKISDIYCFLIVLPGWAEATPLVNLLFEFKSVPVAVISLAGYYTTRGLIAPAGPAVASALKNSMDTLGFKYLIEFQKINENINFGRISNFLNASKTTKELKSIKLASFGYACSNLYPFMYDGNIIKKYTGIHVDNLDLLELELATSEIKENQIKKYKTEFEKNVLFDSSISTMELNRQARYSIALQNILDANSYSAVTMKCMGGFGKLLNFTPCMLLSCIGEKVQAICEADVYNLVLQTIIKKLSGFPVNFLEFFEFYNNSILMASCGFAPSDICRGKKIKVFTHEWDGSRGLMNIAELISGEVTVASMSANEGKLNIHCVKALAKTPELFQEEGWDNRNGPKIPALEIELSDSLNDFMEKITGPHYLVVIGDALEMLRQYAYLNDIRLL